MIEQEIWPKDTGITDLPENWRELVVPEVAQVRSSWAEMQRRAEPENLRTFTERLHREWAIETGIIENLYDIERGVTQTLIEQGFQASLMQDGLNKSPEYVKALLQDQQAALEGLFAFVKQDRPLSVGYIKELHAAMTRSQDTVDAFDRQGHPLQVPMVHGHWKRDVNYPERDGKLFLYCPPEQVQGEMERLVAIHVQHVAMNVPPEVEAAWLHHRFTQIHPFQDGNGRVARALATLVLIRTGAFPLLVPRDEKGIYLDSLERADAGSLRSLVLLVARLQESYFRRASSALAKTSPPSDSVEEAAAKVADVLGGQDHARDEQLKSRVSAIRVRLTESLNQYLSKAFGIIASRDPSARYRVVYADQPSPWIDQVKEAVTRQLEVRIADPHEWFVVHLTLGREFQLVVHLDGAYASIDKDLQIVAALAANERIENLLGRPFYVDAYEDLVAVNHRINGWCSDLVRLVLDELRLQM